MKVDAGTIPFAFAIDPSAHLVYVTNFSSNNVTVIRGPGHSMSAMARPSFFASSVQTTADGSR
jgi:DNA-binding beta-propeller fold protein YncE